MVPSVSVDSVDSLMVSRTRWKSKFPHEHDDDGLDVVDAGVTRELLVDVVDAEITGGAGKAVFKQRASILDIFFSFSTIITYSADMVTGGLVADQYFRNGHFWWFGITASFIFLPSIVIQIFSCRWYKEDKKLQSWYSYILHILQLGHVKRFINAFWFGLKSRRDEKVNKNYFRYLGEWRDITLLRLIEGFLKAAPQMILQLYVLTSRDEFIIDRDWRTSVSAVCSIISLSCAIVSYFHALRLCLGKKTFSLCGYIFQIWYRLLTISSRVIALVLFASVLKAWIFMFVVIHCSIMVFCLSFHKTILYENATRMTQKILEKLFHLIIALIYIFCFINIKEGRTRYHQLVYYLIFFMENCSLMAFWCYYYRGQDWFVVASSSVVLGSFTFGIICMLFYYKFFHPNQDITEGCTRSTCCRRDNEDDASVSSSIMFNYPAAGSESTLSNKGKRDLVVSYLLPQSSTGTPIEVEMSSIDIV